MLHHLSLGVADPAVSAPFDEAVLGALGCVRVWTDLGAAGFEEVARRKPQRPVVRLRLV